MKKRGISQVLVIALIIMIVIVASVLIYNVIIMLIQEKTESGGETITCLTNVDLSLINSCYSSSQVKFTIKNNNNFDYETDFFILRVIKQGTTLDIPTNWYSVLKGLEQREFIADVDNPQTVDEFVFIPKIKEEKGYCYGQAIKFKPEACNSVI